MSENDNDIVKQVFIETETGNELEITTKYVVRIVPVPTKLKILFAPTFTLCGLANVICILLKMCTIRIFPPHLIILNPTHFKYNE